MNEILLSTLNAKYIHTSLGLRYLRANLGELRQRSSILEFTINQTTDDIVEAILQASPTILGFGVYIWNIKETEIVIRALKAIRPDIKVVLGGPELSHENGQESICQIADCTISGEADLSFKEVCINLLDGTAPPPFLKSPLPNIKEIKLPYNEYTDEDLANRLIYVEASRGCPFKCEFCLSSIDVSVRGFDQKEFLDDMGTLLQRGCQKFKFVDRTFNLKANKASAIMDFFLERMREDLFLHFEMIPDRLPDAIKTRLPKFPKGSLQLEIGLQSLNPEVGERISRKMDLVATRENFRFLGEHTTVHTHSDLIFGLPGESLQSIEDSFNQLWDMAPDEIQIGILKSLKGTPLKRHTQEYQMVYSSEPPYELLQNRDLDFKTFLQLKRFARHFEIFINGGRFPNAMGVLIESSSQGPFLSLFHFSKWLWKESQQTHAISLNRQVDVMEKYVSEMNPELKTKFEECLIIDFSNPSSNPKLSKRGLPTRLHSRLASRFKQDQLDHD